MKQGAIKSSEKRNDGITTPAFSVLFKSTIVPTLVENP